MFNFRTLSGNADAQLIGRLSSAASEAALGGVFNPSILRIEDGYVAAFRAIPAGTQAIRAYLVHLSAASSSASVHDLTAAGERAGIPKVADPKLVRIGAVVYATFNTGFVREGRNELFLAPVYPKVGAPQRIVADFDRQRIEKNWAFFEGDSKTVRAVYQLHPYREVCLVQGQLGAEDDLVFASAPPARVHSNMSGTLTIGTQLLVRDDRALLMAHEKWVVPRSSKRTYFGRAVGLTGIGTSDIRVHAYPERLIHRWRDALPRRGVHNYNLLSATYFSGLSGEPDSEDVVLGYGVNDARFSIVRLHEADLWP